MKRVVVLITVILLAGYSLTMLNAEPRPYLQKHMMFGNNIAMKNLLTGRFLLKFKEEIGLTEVQLKKIEKMNFSFQESIIKTTADLKLQEIKLAGYLRADKVDRKQAEKMLRNIGKIKTGMQVDQMNYRLDIKETLTAEQLKKIEQLKKKIGRRLRGRMGRERLPRRDRPMRKNFR